MPNPPHFVFRLSSVILFLALPSCGQSAAAPPLPPARSVNKITIDKIERSYILRFPPKYDGTTKLPLVVLLHGATDSAEYAEKAYHFDEKATAENFILVLPDALGDVHAWSAFGTGDSATQDVAFLTTLVESVEKNYAVDRNRVYIAGHSAGAMMTYRMLTERPDLFAAAGIVAGTVGSETSLPKPKGPMPLILFHGLLDDIVPYGESGGYVDGAIKFWCRENDCPTTPAEHTTTGKVRRDAYISRMPTHPDIILYTLIEGNHMWPGGNIMPGKDMQPVQDISTTNLMWEFFKAHPKAVAATRP